MKKIALDTNILLVSIASKSKYHWVFEAFRNELFTLCVTTDILDEYAEIIEQKMGFQAGENALGVLENSINVDLITTYFRFNLLKDEDDNKFVDCAIAANADFIVTHNSDFNVLKEIDFPNVSVLNLDEFKEIIIRK
ncbi:putative toxin-antitoxin system toxin component, PIN family [Lacihabitans soyangensis]|uniref:Toxin-antitoxin system toxin component, PIN family n=1 Tax=Lacihabitans soyangensis TaxID=869394 RepID=A0AAE3H6Y2_9BACT|nr:putative toxin-antitoxin system toxin component, PIN family [Lacihabitans soyangensis]MCP9765903.1 putative toxin-antitoxin system toxin component, PIN family [Lacihabitans soyangensis]